MGFKHFLLLALIFIFSTLLAVEDLDSFYQKARTKFDSIKTLQADISQTNEFAQSKTKLQSSGILYYKNGNLVLDYFKPGIQKLIIKGNSVQIYDKSNQTLIKTTNQMDISNPLQIVDKYWSASTKTLISEDTTFIRIRMLPLDDKYIQKLEVSFNQSTLMITELSYWDKSGNKVRYKFLNIRTDIPISDSKWNFIPPKGVKVIQR
jgi:outer membrane lipoprotein-sorting protein